MPKKKWYKDRKFTAVIIAAIITAAATIVAKWQCGAGPAVSTPPIATPAKTYDLIIVTLDDETGERLAGVNIASDELGFAKDTDSSGRCSITVPGKTPKLRITVSKKGYVSTNLEMDIFEGMDPARIRLKKN